MSVPNAGNVPEGWETVLRESDADLANGDIVPLSTIRADLRATIEEIEAELARMAVGLPGER